MSTTAPAPVVRRAGLGYRWLATSPPSTTPNIGVFGYTEQDAAEKFAVSWARWVELMTGEPGS